MELGFQTYVDKKILKEFKISCEIDLIQQRKGYYLLNIVIRK